MPGVLVFMVITFGTFTFEGAWRFFGSKTLQLIAILGSEEGFRYGLVSLSRLH